MTDFEVRTNKELEVLIERLQHQYDEHLDLVPEKPLTYLQFVEQRYLPSLEPNDRISLYTHLWGNGLNLDYQEVLKRVQR